MSESIAICGSFDKDGGKPSGYMKRLFEDVGVSVVNGGRLEHLDMAMDWIRHHDLIFWFPDVSNDIDKYLPIIKQLNPKALLVSSKNNSECKYTHKDLVSRMLSSRSNLMLEVYKKDWLVRASVHDPLGNTFIYDSPSVAAVRSALFDRVAELIKIKRVPSISISREVPVVPDETEFFKHIKKYADKFHELIHAVHQDRLLGNASFRCERGFPSFKHNDLIFVSRRNVDKRFIDRDNFVAVTPMRYKMMEKVEYFGDIKPSVDTPVQLMLYDYYKNVKYMLHSHVYVSGAPFTGKVVPCGAVDEFDHILDIYPDAETSNVAVNLKGHGSLVMASDLDMFGEIPYVSRPAPERWDV